MHQFEDVRPRRLPAYRVMAERGADTRFGPLKPVELIQKLGNGFTNNSITSGECARNPPQFGCFQTKMTWTHGNKFSKNDSKLEEAEFVP